MVGALQFKGPFSVDSRQLVLPEP